MFRDKTLLSTVAHFLWGLVLVYVVSIPVGAQIRYFSDDQEYTGTTALPFLKLPVGARALAMGGRNITSDGQATALYWNPGSLAMIPDYWSSFSHAEILGVYRQEYLSSVLPFKERGAWGLSALVMGGSIDGRDINEEKITPLHLDISLGGGFGYEVIPEKLGLGMRLDAIRSQIMDATAQTYGLNFGLLYEPIRDYRLGLAWHNIAHVVQYNTSISPEERMPQRMIVEVGKNRGMSSWSWSLGLLNTIEGEHRYYGGVEYWPVPILALRSGYEYTSNDNELNWPAGLSMGTGLSLQSLLIDLGFQWFPPLGSYAMVGLHYRVVGRSALTETEWLIRAKEAFKKHKLEKAEIYTNKALAINPKYWEAVSLLARIQKEKEKSDGDYLTIIYTSNTHGYIAPIEKEGQYIGGLARRQTVLKELANRYPHHLLLDAGDQVPLGLSPDWGSIVHRAMGLMSYDAVGVSLNTMEKHDLGKTRALAHASGLPFVATNVELSAMTKDAPAVRKMRTSKGIYTSIFALIESEYIPDSLKKDVQVQNPIKAMESKREELRHEGELKIVLYYGSLGLAKQFLLRFPEVDVLILSGQGEMLNQPIVVGSTLILSPGVGGTNVGALSLRLGKNGRIEGFEHSLYPLVLTIAPDPEIAALIAPVVMTLGTSEQQMAAGLLTASEFVFVQGALNERGGRISFYASDRTVTSISPKDLRCFDPHYQASERKVMYRCTEPSGENLYIQNPESPSSQSILQAKDGFGRIAWGQAGNILAVKKTPVGGDLVSIQPGIHAEEILFSGRYTDITNFDLSRSTGLWALERKVQERHEIWIVNDKAEGLLRVTPPELDCTRPSWSPDGSHIAYLSTSDGQSGSQLQIFSVHTRKHELVSDQARIEDFKWSPDGRSIFFTAGVNWLDIHRHVLGGNQTKWVTNPQPPTPRSEQTLVPYTLRGESGFLFEAVTDTSVSIHWVAENGKRSLSVVGPNGFNYLR